MTLWSLHPFPSIVRALEIPEIALDHVARIAHFGIACPLPDGEGANAEIVSR